jgi:hypothetical protein
MHFSLKRSSDAGLCRVLHAALVTVICSALGLARAQGLWSTSQLSVTRGGFASTSVGDVALFAGGSASGALSRDQGSVISKDVCLRGDANRANKSAAHYHVVFTVVSAPVALTHGATGGLSNVVDIFHLSTWAWSTAQLSVARNGLIATSVGNEAIFAGGRGELFAENYNPFRLISTLHCVPPQKKTILSYSLHCSRRPLFKHGRFVQLCNQSMEDCSAQCCARFPWSHINREPSDICRRLEG